MRGAESVSGGAGATSTGAGVSDSSELARSLDVGDERVFQVLRFGRLHYLGGSALREDNPGMHEAHSVAALGFVHEMR